MSLSVKENLFFDREGQNSSIASISTSQILKNNNFSMNKGAKLKTEPNKAKYVFSFPVHPAAILLPI